ncbi:M64 family metallopeptidase [Nanoarchaeota archaeon]
MEKGALEFSMRTFVMMIFAIAVFISGFALIESYKIDLPSFEKGMPQFFDIQVSPGEGQQGTVFNIEVDFVDKELVYYAEARLSNGKEVLLYDDGAHGDMNKDDGIYAGVVDSEDFEAGKYIVDIVINPSESQITYPNVSEFVVYKDNCIPIVYNGDPDEKIDVTFLPWGYEDFGEFRKDALKLAGFPEKGKGILTYDPFKDHASKFNFYILNQSADLDCQKGCYGVESLVCCSNNKVSAAASQCPSDQIIILLDENEFCGSASSYAKICNGWNLGQVGTHEFGHIFGGLGDEYVYEDVYPGYEGILTAYPNCDVKECPKWSTFWPGCIGGCGVSARNRPTDKDCLMYTYTDQFDLVDQKHLLSILLDYRKGEVMEIAAPPLEKTYSVGLNYEEGKLTANSVYATQSRAPDRKNLRKIDYFAKVLSYEGKVLDTFKFEFPRMEYPAMPREEDNFSSSPVVLENTNLTLFSKYFDDAEKMEVYNLKNEKLLTVDLGYFADTCGDNLCQKHESAIECPADCSNEGLDDICNYNQDNVCDPDCVRLDPDCGFGKQTLYLILGGVVAGLFLIVALLSKKVE